MNRQPELSTLWFVAHTRPRCEKKLAAYCRLEGIEPTLPCYISVKKYDRKVVKFKKPLFPNYLFLRLLPDQRKIVYQSDYVANLLEVFDQKTFEEQLQDILRTLDLDIEVQAEPQITEGRIVQIKSGPLRGMEGIVESRTGQICVTLRLDFIGQSAVVKLDVSDIELTD